MNKISLDDISIRTRGYQKSYLLTTDELFVAASLYRRMGYQLVDEIPSASFGKPLREQRYDLDLSR